MTPFALVDFWDVDPAPVPPTTDPSLMAYWRFWSAWKLAQR